MKVPNITFSEANVGRSPIRQGIKNRIGIVGEFSRGPANIASFPTGFSDFATRYGSNTRKGSLAYQAAYDQGARDFCLVRVLGNATKAKGSLTVSGLATKANNLLLHLRYVGDILDRGDTPLTTIVTSTGTYTGTNSGRYYFKVTDIDGNLATVKYVFYPLGTDPDLSSNITSPLVIDSNGNVSGGTGDPNEDYDYFINNNSINLTTPVSQLAIDWDSVSDNIEVNLSTNKGTAITVENGIKLAFGTSSQSTNVSLKANDAFSLRVSAYTFSVPVNQGDLPNQIVTSFIETLVGVEPIGEIVRNSSDNGVVFELDNNFEGSIGNKFNYYFTLSDTSSPGITLTNNTSINSSFMQGGQDGPRNAVRDFYSINGTPLLRLLAVSEGSWANQLRVNLYPLNNKQFRLSIQDLNSDNFNPPLANESYLLDFSDTDDNGFLNQLNSSIYIRGIFLPKASNPQNYNINLINESPVRLAPSDSNISNVNDIRHSNFYGPSKLVNISLENGYDGPKLTESDYIKGLATLESQPVHIVLCPGQYESLSIRSALIAHAEKAQDLEGLRIAVLNARPNLSPNAAKQEAIGLDSKRGVMVVGWSTYAGQPNALRFGLSPDALYAGKLASIPFFAGPNARRTAGAVFNISEVDTISNSNMSALQVYTDARLEILALDPSSQSYLFTNGRTITADTSWDKIFIRRTYDYIRKDLYDLLQQYKSEPHTNLLRAQVVSAINAYMGELARSAQIARFTSVVADSTNNSAEDYLAGKLNISVSFLPLYAIDEVVITMIRDTNSGLVSFGS